MIEAKNIILDHAAEQGLGETGMIALLCNFIDHEAKSADRLIHVRLQAFVDKHSEELERPES